MFIEEEMHPQRVTIDQGNVEPDPCFGDDDDIQSEIMETAKWDERRHCHCCSLRVVGLNDFVQSTLYTLCRAAAAGYLMKRCVGG